MVLIQYTTAKVAFRKTSKDLGRMELEGDFVKHFSDTLGGYGVKLGGLADAANLGGAHVVLQGK